MEFETGEEEQLLELLRVLDTAKVLARDVKVSRVKARYSPVTKLSQAVVTVRKREKISQNLLADLAGVSLGTVRKIEDPQKVKTVTLEILMSVLSALGISLWIK